MVVFIVVDPDQDGLPGYVETWVIRSWGYVTVRRSSIAHQLDLYVKSMRLADYRLRIKDAIMKRHGASDSSERCVGPIRSEAAKRELREEVDALFARSRLIARVRTRSMV
jgi:hypothetical protein